MQSGSRIRYRQFFKIECSVAEGKFSSVPNPTIICLNQEPHVWFLIQGPLSLVKKVKRANCIDLGPFVCAAVA